MPSVFSLDQLRHKDAQRPQHEQQKKDHDADDLEFEINDEFSAKNIRRRPLPRGWRLPRAEWAQTPAITFGDKLRAACASRWVGKMTSGSRETCQRKRAQINTDKASAEK